MIQYIIHIFFSPLTYQMTKKEANSEYNLIIGQNGHKIQFFPGDGK